MRDNLSDFPEQSASTNYRRWSAWRRWLGQRSERLAAGFLKKKGFRILAYNLTESLGEIDLLALDGETLVVVEVRSSSIQNPVDVALTVNKRKQQILTRTILRFLTRHHLQGLNVRFDILAIHQPLRGEPSLYHIPDAFQAVGRFQFDH